MMVNPYIVLPFLSILAIQGDLGIYFNDLSYVYPPPGSVGEEDRRKDPWFWVWDEMETLQEAWNFCLWPEKHDVFWPLNFKLHVRKGIPTEVF